MSTLTELIAESVKDSLTVFKAEGVHCGGCEHQGSWIRTLQSTNKHHRTTTDADRIRLLIM